jgi:hypothetical protein
VVGGGRGGSRVVASALAGRQMVRGGAGVVRAMAASSVGGRGGGVGGVGERTRRRGHRLCDGFHRPQRSAAAGGIDSAKCQVGKKGWAFVPAPL